MKIKDGKFLSCDVFQDEAIKICILKSLQSSKLVICHMFMLGCCVVGGLNPYTMYIHEQRRARK